MLRKHFAMSGDNKPDFTITYHASKHVPFFGGYAKNWVYGYPLYGGELGIDENPIKFKVIGDKWNNGVGEWNIKLADSSNRIYNSCIIGKKLDNLTEAVSVGLGWADWYIKNYGNGVLEESVDNTNTITSVIFGEGIETINESILSGINGTQSSCAEITLPKSVTLLTGDLFNKYISLKSITVPLNVIRIDNLCNIGGENSLEEVILKPLTPPDASNTSSQTPLGLYSNNVKDSLKIRVYADCIDTYKNDSIWCKYSDLYDTINDTIVYYDGPRKLYTEYLDITSVERGAVPTNVISVYLPNSVTKIGESAFESCSYLTFIAMSNSISEIGKYAFLNCSSLTSISIPNSVTSIGVYAFSQCSHLTSITIGNSVTSIGEFVFNGCDVLTSIIVDENNTVYDSRDNCNAVIKTKTNTLIYGCKNTIIPNSVTSIGDNAFYKCISIASITIPDSVTSIKDYAFWGCSKLASVVIVNSVTSIGRYAFRGCTGLTSVTMSTIVPPSLGLDVFYLTPSNLIIYVPDESVDAYKSASGWTSYASKIKPLSEKPA